MEWTGDDGPRAGGVPCRGRLPLPPSTTCSRTPVAVACAGQATHHAAGPVTGDRVPCSWRKPFS
jgi:hypothetical protein